MAPPTRPQHYIDLGHLPPLVPSQSKSATSTAASSPIEPSGNGSRLPPSGNNTNAVIGGTSIRLGTASPNHEFGSRFYPRRARELQASSGGNNQTWGPPTASGLSTPLRETIPESPGDDDTFPDLGVPTTSNEPLGQSAAIRRARAGTVPSRFPPGLFSSSQLPSAQRSSRVTPSGSPYRSGAATPAEGPNQPVTETSPTSAAAFLSRFRAGSMPQRTSLLTTQSPFGSSVFSSSWNTGRGRASTLSGQTDDPTSPVRSGYRKDSLLDTDIRTLNYLGLIDPSPQSATADTTSLDALAAAGYDASLRPSLASTGLPSNRFRSYSVNAKEKYVYDDEDETTQGPYYSGTLTPSAEAAAQALAVTRAQIHQHNLEVQAFANQASSNRPRARTAGLLDAPSSRFWRNYVLLPSRQENTVIATDLDTDNGNAFEIPHEAIQVLQMQQNQQMSQNQITQQLPNRQIVVDSTGDEEPSRALWLGNVPPSETSSSLKAAFEAFGKVESARVLSHKSCGFVNFDRLESAVLAKSTLVGKELFTGAGPLRIGFAKAQSSSVFNSAPEGTSSASPGPAVRSDVENNVAAVHKGMANLALKADVDSAQLNITNVTDMRSSILNIVRELGASHDEQARISTSVDIAFGYDDLETEIQTVLEPSQSRIHDAPRLREIRKRIDNNMCSPAELEDMALTMLPEIVELSSDYLGNTVVQKLFEFCSESVKEAMLQEIGPHLAEIGVHKNGTWAAQKIIDVARTPTQMRMIVDGLRPYSVPCFLDQYGNYVMQCCLRFGPPWNNFMFEVMLARLLDVAQGRFGARAMRASLESHHVSKEQQKMLAAAIALNVVQLATNANGALLLTWYLDTCTFPNRRKVLAPRLVEHIVDVCTHKVAHLTVLKVINQRNEPEARDIVLRAIFFSSQEEYLTEILKDQSCGATLIFKILTTPFFDEPMRSEIAEKVRNVLILIKAQPSQGYKRLMDEVQLATRGQTGAARESPHVSREKTENSRPSSKHEPANSNAGFVATQTLNGQANGTYFSPNTTAQSQAAYTPDGSFHAQMNQSMAAVGPYAQYNLSPVNGTNQIPQSVNAQLISPTQIQYQASRPMAMYTSDMHNFAGQSPQMPQFYQNMARNNMMASPQHFQMPPGAILAQPGFNPQNGFGPMMNMGVNRPGMWPQFPNSFILPQQQMQGQAMMGDGRRGRR